MEQIMQADDGEVVKPLNRSKGEYWVGYESTLRVLADGKTLIGVGSDRTTLITEDITDDQKPVKIGKHKNGILSLIFIEESKMLLVGDMSKKVFQYRLNRNKTWTFIKDYGNIGIGLVYSCTRIMNLVIFGGFETSSLRVIDSEKMVVIGDAYRTAIERIFSLSICKRPDQLVLSVNGLDPSYSNEVSDVLDITDFVKNYGTIYKAPKNHFLPQTSYSDFNLSLFSHNQQLLQENYQLKTQLNKYKRIIERNKNSSTKLSDFEFKIRELSHQLIIAQRCNKELQSVKIIRKMKG
jgi:hypothetical protein